MAPTSGLLFCPCCCRNPLTSAVILPLCSIVGRLSAQVCHTAVRMQSCQASLLLNEQTYSRFPSLAKRKCHLHQLCKLDQDITNEHATLSVQAQAQIITLPEATNTDSHGLYKLLRIQSVVLINTVILTLTTKDQAKIAIIYNSIILSYKGRFRINKNIQAQFHTSSAPHHIILLYHIVYVAYMMLYVACFLLKGG